MHRVAAVGPVGGRIYCDGQGGGHAAFAKIVLVMDKPLLWGWGAKNPRAKVYACSGCEDGLVAVAVERGAKVVARRELGCQRGKQ